MGGTGSVFQRANGKWIALVSVGPRGARRRISRTRATQKQAELALAKLQSELRKGQRPTRLTLGAYLRQWLDDSARPTISANTYRGYQDVIGHFDAIAQIPLTALTAEDLERAFNAMVAKKGLEKNWGPASPKTIRNAQIMMRRALGQAEKRGHVERNVAELVPLRRVPRYRVAALTPERAKAILDAIKGDRYEAAYALAFLGLREGEIRGLAWSDFDRAKRTVSLRHQVFGNGPDARLGPLKTEASEDTIPLPPFIVSRLLEHERLQDLERPIQLEAKDSRLAKADSLIFVTADGWPFNASWFTKHFQKLLELAELPTMRLHDLRHGAASLLVDAGVHERIVQELLRHAPGSKMTMGRYAHVTEAQQRAAVDSLDRAVAG